MRRNSAKTQDDLTLEENPEKQRKLKCSYQASKSISKGDQWVKFVPFDQSRMKVQDFVEGNARALKEEDEAIKGVSENDGTVIGSARF